MIARSHHYQESKLSSPTWILNFPFGMQLFLSSSYSYIGVLCLALLLMQVVGSKVGFLKILMFNYTNFFFAFVFQPLHKSFGEKYFFQLFWEVCDKLKC